MHKMKVAATLIAIYLLAFSVRAADSPKPAADAVKTSNLARAASAVTLPGSNLIQNCGFEQGQAARDGTLKPYGWTVRVTGRQANDSGKPRTWPGTDVPEITVSKDAARSGKYGLLMEESQIEPRQICELQMDLPDVQKSDTYQFSACVRTVPGKMARAHIDVYGEKYGPTETSYRYFVDSEWRRISFNFRFRKHVPKLPADKPGAVTAYLRLVGWTGTGAVMWDDVECYRVNELPRHDPDPLAKQGREFFARPSPTEAGKIVVELPTLHELGLQWPIRGDFNLNGKVAVQYREAGSDKWQHALPMHRMMWEWCNRVYRVTDWVTPNAYAGSVLNLKPDTEYELKLSLADPDGGSVERTVKTRTKAEPREFSGGRKLHVYPPDHKGEKLSPSFAGLRPAYAEAQPGDIILVHAGLYTVSESERMTVSQRENYNEEYGPAHYLLNKAGAPDRPIIIRGAGDGEAVFEGDGKGMIFCARKADYTWLENITLKSAKRLALFDYGLGIVVRKCKFIDA